MICELLLTSLRTCSDQSLHVPCTPFDRPYRQETEHPNSSAVRHAAECRYVVQSKIVELSALNTRNIAILFQRRSFHLYFSRACQRIDYCKFSSWPDLMTAFLAHWQRFQSLPPKPLVCAVDTTLRKRHRPLNISIIADPAIVRFVLERHSPFQSQRPLTLMEISVKNLHLQRAKSYKYS